MSALTVGIAAGDAARAHWDAWVRGQPASTVYHAWAFNDALAGALRYRWWPLWARDGNGRIRAVLPIHRVPGLRGARLVSVPFRDRGGPLWDDDDAFAAVVAEAGALATREGARNLVLKSALPWPAPLERASGLTGSRYWVRSVLPLAGITRAGYLQGLDAKTRNMIRQAEGAGAIFEDLGAGPAAVAAWYPLHVATQRRLGVPVFPRAYFERLFAGLGPAGAVSLVGVRAAGALVAAAILLHWGGATVYGYSASSPRGRDVRANDFMLFNVIALLAERGEREFDLGSDSPKQDGLLFFKRKWGAQASPTAQYARVPVADGALDSSDARYGIAREVFRRLPAPAIVALGGLLTRYFG